MCKVDIYSNCDKVELIHNGKLLGCKLTGRSEKIITQWEVPYVEGELKALGYKKGVLITSDKLNTAEQPTEIKLSAGRGPINR